MCESFNVFQPIKTLIEFRGLRFLLPVWVPNLRLFHLRKFHRFINHRKSQGFCEQNSKITRSIFVFSFVGTSKILLLEIRIGNFLLILPMTDYLRKNKGTNVWCIKISALLTADISSIRRVILKTILQYAVHILHIRIGASRISSPVIGY